MRAGQHVLRPLGAGKRVSRDASDVTVVTDNAGQRDGAQVSPLGGAEHAFLFPPEPRGGGKEYEKAPGISRMSDVWQ